MTDVRLIFFGLHNTLIDSAALRTCYERQIGFLMSQRYGQRPSDWSQAYHTVLMDWNSYYADLDLSGEDGVAHMWEGLYRTTRALFRLVDVQEPTQTELTQLARQLPAQVMKQCDTAFPDTLPAVQQLGRADYTLGVFSHIPVEHTRSLLEGSRILPYFTGLIIGIDMLDHFIPDALYFRQISHLANEPPHCCMVVDHQTDVLQSAKEAGFATVQICRTASSIDTAISTLPELLTLLEK